MIKWKAAPLNKSMYLVSQGWWDHKELDGEVAAANKQ